MNSEHGIGPWFSGKWILRQLKWKVSPIKVCVFFFKCFLLKFQATSWMWHVIDHHGCSYYCLGRFSQIQNDLDGLVSDGDVKLRSWKVMTLLSGHGNSIAPSKATSLNFYYILIIRPLFFWRVSWWGGHGCKHLFFNIFWRSGHFGENLWSPDEDLPVGAGIPNQIPSRIVGENHGKSWNPASLAEDILSFIGILLFVGLKATYVFFSWLNYFLLASGLNVVAISLLVFAIGFLMFMLPIVPGTAVYLFSGVVAWRLWWLACVGGTKSICEVMLSANTCYLCMWTSPPPCWSCWESLSYKVLSR